MVRSRDRLSRTVVANRWFEIKIAIVGSETVIVARVETDSRVVGSESREDGLLLVVQDKAAVARRERISVLHGECREMCACAKTKRWK